MNYEKMDKEEIIKILRKKDNMLKKIYSQKKKLSYYANTDELTGVLNKRSGEKLLQKEFELSKISNKNMVVCFVDIDRFKMVNDTLGHLKGDELLKNTGELLKENIRKTDFIIRIGGDEFLIVFPETTIEEAENVLNRINTNIEKISKKIDNCKLSLSYGFFEYNKETKNVVSYKELVHKADSKMYEMKLKKIK